MFKIDVPIDASALLDAKPDHSVKVLAVPAKGPVQSQSIALGPNRQAIARFTFDRPPEGLRVLVGPADASDEDMLGMDLPSVTLSRPRIAALREARLPPIVIKPFFWQRWLARCRTFVIRGRVICPSGRAVPGALVTAYDIDAFWWWSSRQIVARATTDADGTFEMKFRWCCGLLPRLWWKQRVWQLDHEIAGSVVSALRLDPRLRKIPAPTPEPDVAVFSDLLETALPAQRGPELDPAILAPLRERLAQRLPEIPDLVKLKLWPWFPWQPWFDCTPDILFRVTQACQGQTVVIVDEGLRMTRWDIPQVLQVTLTANELACCVPPSHDCTVSTVCGDTLNHIGGNLAAPSAPAGYQSPAGADRPYAGTVEVRGEVDTGDYYEVEYSRFADDPSLDANWHPVPPDALGTIHRQYVEISGGVATFHPVPFAPASIDGRTVIETRGHYEAVHGNRLWVGAQDDLVVAWDTTKHFVDATYRLRIVSYRLADGHLVDREVRPVCPGAEGDTGRHVVLTLDNQTLLPGPVDNHGKPCGPGTVHGCTEEPDTDIIELRFNGAIVKPCDIVDARNGGALEIRFRASDAQGHLSHYALDALHGENETHSLLAEAAPTGGATSQPGHTYALALTQGALRPSWQGGVFTLTIPNLAESPAFPRSCAYLLRLRAYKRTIVSCSHNHAHMNESTVTFTVLFA